MKFGIVIALIVVLTLTVFYWTRYQVVEIHAAGGSGFYMINRLTGDIKQVAYQEIFQVREGSTAAQGTPKPK